MYTDEAVSRPSAGGLALPRIRRRFLIDPAEVAVYHCINRCVRRSFLCGQDPLSGRNYEHRRQWIQDRMQFLAGQFSIDILGFSVMSNHIHVVVRNRPDVVQGWSDIEVARRWWNIFPKRRDDDGHAKEPTDFERNVVILGQVGLWTKPDAVTHFDNVTLLPAAPGFDELSVRSSSKVGPLLYRLRFFRQEVTISISAH